MTSIRSTYFRFLLLSILCIASSVTTAYAIDFYVIVEEKQPQPQQNHNGFRLEHFEQWVFNEQIDVNGARKKLAERLQSEAESIRSIFQLTQGQIDKLSLAGMGDIQAFMHEYEKTKEHFKNNLHDQQAMQNIWQDIQPLQQKYRGQMFGQGSLFAKIMKHLLDEDQLRIMQKLKREQSKFYYQSAVRQTILQIDQVSPLTHKNRQHLLELIEKHTYPPKNIPAGSQAHFLNYYVYGQLGNIPEKQLQAIFPDATWDFVKKQIRQGTGMKRHLDQQGLVPDKG